MLLALYPIALALVAELLSAAHWTPEATTRLGTAAAWVYDDGLTRGQAYCDCDPTPKVIHVAALTLDRRTVAHEATHALDWPTLDRAERRRDRTRLLTEAPELAPCLAHTPLDQEEHLDTALAECLVYRVERAPAWFRARYLAEYAPEHRLYLPLSDS